MGPAGNPSGKTGLGARARALGARLASGGGMGRGCIAVPRDQAIMGNWIIFFWMAYCTSCALL